MSDVTGEARKPSALEQWFKSMKTGTAVQLEAAATAVRGCYCARALEDPKDKSRVVVLVWTEAHLTTPAKVCAAIQEVAAAGVTVEVIEQDGQ